jgi:hypothetical protein
MFFMVPLGALSLMPGYQHLVAAAFPSPTRWARGTSRARQVFAATGGGVWC